MKLALLIGTLAVLSTNASAQSVLDTLRGAVNDNINQGNQSTTITYEHVSQRAGECESQALRIAGDRAKAACQQQYRKDCQVVDQPGIVRTEEEVRLVARPIEERRGHTTNEEQECESMALRAAREAAQASCVLRYGVDAACATDQGRILTPTRRIEKIPGIRNRHRYECGASAIASPTQNSSALTFTCTATATARVKRSGLGGIIRL